MGRDDSITIQIKGTAYKFAPIPTEDIERLMLILNMNVPPEKTIKLLTRVLSSSAGDEQWNAITDLWLSGEMTIKDATVGLFERIVTKQAKTMPADDAQ